jgi:hypothetical protein
MESLLPIIIQLISGAAGGNVAGALLKNLSLGTVGNSVAGALGGLGGANLLPAILGSGVLDGMVGSIAGGGIGGIVLTAIVGLIKNMMSK